MKGIYRYEIYVSGKAPGGVMNTRYIIKDNYTGTETRYDAVIGKGNGYEAHMASLLLALQQVNGEDNRVWRTIIKIADMAVINSSYGNTGIAKRIREEKNKFLSCRTELVSGVFMAQLFDGITEEQAIQKYTRKSGKYKRFLDEVKTRDGNKCIKCGSDKHIHVHHIVSISENGELATDISNGACLCKKCHTDFHVRFMGAFCKPCNRNDFDNWIKG